MACSMPNRYLSQYKHILIAALTNKFEWKMDYVQEVIVNEI